MDILKGNRLGSVDGVSKTLSDLQCSPDSLRV